MLIIDDIRSLKKQLICVDINDYIEYNELAYRGRTSSNIYAYCPHCGRPLQIPLKQIGSEDLKRIRLKKTVSCDCREALRYINKNFEWRFLKASSSWGKHTIGMVMLGLAVASLLPIRLYHLAIDSVPSEDLGASFFIITAIPFALGLMALIAFLSKPEQRIQKLRDPNGDRDRILDIIREIDEMQAQAQEKALAQQKQKKANREDGIHGFNNQMAVAGGVAGTADPQAAYIPSDFEPDLDPYDREALHEEQMLDDWVIAGGGNPYDFDDRVDVFTDPFGFHDDFGGGFGGGDD